jgi:hypothetical protein
MANNIDFKYINSDTTDPICGLTINYTVKVIAVLANYKQTNPPRPRGSVYTSNVILEGVETTDSNGIITLDVTNVFSDDEFEEIFNKFSNSPGYNVSIEIILSSDKQEIGPYMYISRTDIPKELSAYNVYFDKENDEYVYRDLEYYTTYNDFEVDEIVIDKELLEAIQTKKLEARKKYLETLEDFQSEIVSQAPLQIPVLNEYDPINITQIITRCLELDAGTIENALAYTKDAGLIAETNRLNKIKTLVGQISNLYPTITIEDGEGLPYQNVGVIPDVFRGFGFYQDGDDMFVQAYIFGQESGKKCEDQGIVTPEYPVSVDVNGTVVFNSALGYDGKFTNFVSNLSEDFNKKNVTLVPGDIVTVSVFFECQHYYTKLIIKN